MHDAFTPTTAYRHWDFPSEALSGAEELAVRLPDPLLEAAPAAAPRAAGQQGCTLPTLAARLNMLRSKAGGLPCGQGFWARVTAAGTTYADRKYDSSVIQAPAPLSCEFVTLVFCFLNAIAAPLHRKRTRRTSQGRPAPGKCTQGDQEGPGASLLVINAANASPRGTCARRRPPARPPAAAPACLLAAVAVACRRDPTSDSWDTPQQP